MIHEIFECIVCRSRFPDAERLAAHSCHAPMRRPGNENPALNAKLRRRAV